MNCPDGDPINQNVVVNAVDNGFFLDPVEVIDASIVDNSNTHYRTVRRDL